MFNDNILEKLKIREEDIKVPEENIANNAFNE